MIKIKNLYEKYREIINYIIVGGLTTLVSILSYFVFSRIFDINDNYYFVLANILSWICAVIFAYIANKIYVFESKTNKKETAKEFVKFTIARIATLLIDLTTMYILVKIIEVNNDISKIILQFIIVILNYLFSKLLVFKK